MSQFGKDTDPTKHFGAPDTGVGGAQKDCYSCGNRDHVQHARLGDNWDKTKQNTSDLAGAAQASADRAQEKSGGILGP